jgi:hypothetical protein
VLVEVGDKAAPLFVVVERELQAVLPTDGHQALIVSLHVRRPSWEQPNRPV